jgi:hypothetical protein
MFYNPGHCFSTKHCFCLIRSKAGEKHPSLFYVLALAPTRFQICQSAFLLCSSCLLVYLAAYLPVCQPVCLFVFLSAYLPACLSVCLLSANASQPINLCLPTCLSAFLSLCLPACFLLECLPACASAFLPVCPSACLPACLTVCLPIC